MLCVALLVVLVPAVLCEAQLKIIEGDIVVDQATQDIIDGKVGHGYEAITSKKWPNGKIPYEFAPNFESSRRAVVMQAINEYRTKTCITFKERHGERDYILFVVGRGCYSYIGRIGGKQEVSIGEGCQYFGICLHEMMHAAGFFHEQSRKDRDSHIKIYWNNIVKGMEHNFKKYIDGDTLREPYDYDSLMHYRKRAFSINGRNTIEAIGDRNRQLGQRRGFSIIDVRQLNKMYECGNVTPNPTTNPTPNPTTNPTPNPTQQPLGCWDKISHCNDYEHRGFCTSATYAECMRRNCCRTCSKSTKCLDKVSGCPRYAKRGYCTEKYFDYMRTNCCRACLVV